MKAVQTFEVMLHDFKLVDPDCLTYGTSLSLPGLTFMPKGNMICSGLLTYPVVTSSTLYNAVVKKGKVVPVLFFNGAPRH
jgi:hypothetical protein